MVRIPNSLWGYFWYMVLLTVAVLIVAMLLNLGVDPVAVPVVTVVNEAGGEVRGVELVCGEKAEGRLVMDSKHVGELAAGEQADVVIVPREKFSLAVRWQATDGEEFEREVGEGLVPGEIDRIEIVLKADGEVDMEMD
ncbi:hypothetical protein STSP2_00515 [Anaerohalosphaera lusitana]|uniref:Uncharacterized protein n=1 Tax=Anaerohalosphaera lusitana TaxID=1936003 RepID=A0A1U9NHH5_9BACT|nr:hypothetical protein [Anaerohalosphaera lusitana]AQT67371.1 hypothetical protein STSP2_00515 [Anaerohalosphaera lusitana]